MMVGLGTHLIWKEDENLEHKVTNFLSMEDKTKWNGGVGGNTLLTGPGSDSEGKLDFQCVVYMVLYSATWSIRFRMDWSGLGERFAALMMIGAQLVAREQTGEL